MNRLALAALFVATGCGGSGSNDGGQAGSSGASAGGSAGTGGSAGAGAMGGTGATGGSGGTSGSAGMGGSAGAPQPACLNDFQPPTCTTTSDCTVPNTECLRGVCIRACGGDLAMLDGAIGSGIEYLGSVCTSRFPGADVHVRTEDGCDKATVYSIAGGNSGGDTFDWNLFALDFDPAGLVSQETQIGDPNTVIRPGSGNTNGTRGSLALRPDFSQVAFTITDDTTFDTEIYLQNVTDGSFVTGPMNDGLVVGDWLDQDHLAVPGVKDNGGFTTFGLTVFDFGDSPPTRSYVVDAGNTGVDSVAVLRGAGFVLMGIPDAPGRIIALPVGDVLDAVTNGTEIDARTDPRVIDVGLASSNFRVLDEEFLVTFSNGSFDDEEYRPIMTGSGTVSLGPAMPLGSANTFDAVVGLGNRRVVFSHFSGAIYGRIP